MSIDRWMVSRLQKIGTSLLQVDPGPRRTPAALSHAAAEVILLSRFYCIFVVFAIGTSIFLFDRAYMGGPPTAAIWANRCIITANRNRVAGEWYLDLSSRIEPRLASLGLS